MLYLIIFLTLLLVLVHFTSTNEGFAPLIKRNKSKCYLIASNPLPGPVVPAIPDHQNPDFFSLPIDDELEPPGLIKLPIPLQQTPQHPKPTELKQSTTRSQSVSLTSHQNAKPTETIGVQGHTLP